MSATSSRNVHFIPYLDSTCCNHPSITRHKMRLTSSQFPAKPHLGHRHGQFLPVSSITAAMMWPQKSALSLVGTLRVLVEVSGKGEVEGKVIDDQVLR